MSAPVRTEQWWLADAIRPEHADGRLSIFFAAIEESDVLLIDSPAQQQIVDARPGSLARDARTGFKKDTPAAKDLAHRQGIERKPRGALPGLHEHVSDDRAARAAMDGGVITWASRRRPLVASAKTCREVDVRALPHDPVILDPDQWLAPYQPLT
jgi:hypothetical protein